MGNHSYSYSLMRPVFIKCGVYCVQTIQYISDLGGLFGLWFGFALFVFAELYELVTDLITIGFWHIFDAVYNRQRK